jgi:hypothetical protein
MGSGVLVDRGLGLEEEGRWGWRRQMEGGGRWRISLNVLKSNRARVRVRG